MFLSKGTCKSLPCTWKVRVLGFLCLESHGICEIERRLECSRMKMFLHASRRVISMKLLMEELWCSGIGHSKCGSKGRSIPRLRLVI